MFGRFALGCVLGFSSSSFPSVWCDARSERNVSADGQTNWALSSLPMPTKEELEYVKTWGVRWVDDWDRPGERGIRADRSRSVKRQMILVRHGQYANESSDDDRIRTLTPLGEQQAKLTGEYLWKAFLQRGVQHGGEQNCAEMVAAGHAAAAAVGNAAAELTTGNGPRGFVILPEPKYIHVSDMTRAQQTAKLILEQFPNNMRKRLATDAALRERFPCDPEPPRRGRHAKYSDMRAVENVFEKYFHRPTSDESSVEILVGHANVIRYLVCRALQLPPEAWLRISLPHCSITSVIIGGNGHVSLSCLGSAGHLPADMITTRNVA